MFPVLRRILLGGLIFLPLPVFAGSADLVMLRGLQADGWAAMEGGTTGGARASDKNVFHVHDIDGLREVLHAAADTPKIVVVEGMIDATGGRAFSDKQDQARRTQIRIPDNTTLAGADNRAGFVNAALSIKGVENIIVRNLTIQNPWDEYPQWDPDDGPSGHWNSEYDGMTIDHSTHVWIDHVAFTDAPRTDDQNGRANGQEVQHHDGALDIKKASDYVTVSNCVFAQHDKNTLVGHSDKYTQDAGHLRVTFHDNLFRDIVQRAPRVRYGQVHVYNNDYVGAKKAPVYPHMYSIGLGTGARVISEANVFAIEGAKSMCDVVKSYGGTQFSDSGSLLEGKPLESVAACKGSKGMTSFATPDWKPPYQYALLPVSDVAAHVAAQAGPR